MKRILLLAASLAAQGAMAFDRDFLFPGTADSNTVQSRHAPLYIYQWDNDAFLVGSISDRFYTNGLRFDYQYEADDLYWQQDDGNLTPLGCDDNDGTITLQECAYFNQTAEHADVLERTHQVTRRIFFGQQMFTPSDIRWPASEYKKYERPYAGWLYAGMGSTQQNAYGYETMEWSIGCIGPCSEADDAQKTIHRNLGDQQPKGWDTQLKNNPVIQVHYRSSLSLIGLPWGKGEFLQTYVEADAGNLINRTGLGMRFELPIGFGGRDIAIRSREVDCNRGLNLNQQYLNTTSPCQRQIYTARHSITAHELRFYADASAYAVAYNGLLQGPLGDSHKEYVTTGHKPFLTSWVLGAALQLNRTVIDMSYHSRSTESDGENTAFNEHSWMNLTVAVPDEYYLGIPVTIGILWMVSVSGH